MYEVWLEIFGYIGTGLIVASMMMTSIGWLRILNISGSVISATYSALCGALPIVVLNISLIAINLFHLIRERLLRKGGAWEGKGTSRGAAIVGETDSTSENAHSCREISTDKE